MNLDEALSTFVAEARDLLQGMEDALLALEQDPTDAEAIAATFRAMHTIKGSAGLFSLDDLVAFAHVAETVLDKVRNGALAIDATLIALLLQSGDHLGSLLNRVTGEADTVDDLGRPSAGDLLTRLQAYIGGPHTEAAPQEPHHAPGAAAPQAPDGVANGAWHISLRFGQDVLKCGMDPASFLRYLGTLGRIRAIAPSGTSCRKRRKWTRKPATWALSWTWKATRIGKPSTGPSTSSGMTASSPSCRPTPPPPITGPWPPPCRKAGNGW